MHRRSHLDTRPGVIWAWLGYTESWNALEYWEFTEQIFRSVCVLTNKRTPYGETKHQDVNFFIKYIPKKCFPFKKLGFLADKLEFKTSLIDEPK